MIVRNWAVAMAILLAIGAVGLADESDHDAVSQIRDHLAGFQLDAAEELLQSALQKYPNSDRLKSLHYSLYLANLQRADGNAAARHIIACVRHELERFRKDRALPDDLAAFVRLMVSAHKETRRPQAAIRTIDDVLNTIEYGSNTEDRVVAELLQDLRLGKVSLLSYGGKVAAAKEILAKEHDRAKAALNENPEDTQLVMQLAKVLAARVTLATDTASKSRPRAFREYRRFLDDQVRRHPNEANILRALRAEYLQELSRLSRTQPDNAEQMLRRLE